MVHIGDSSVVAKNMYFLQKDKLLICHPTCSSQIDFPKDNESNNNNTVCGQHNVNIAHMALGREKNEPGGSSVAVLNLDNQPSQDVLSEISDHPEVTGVELVRLPAAGAALPWLVGG